ncbi:MAG: RNA-binding protein [Phycisphaerae bacterium]|nr:MAG: RNA-binding protein [Phycisphaerae bacterium]
MCPVDRSIQIGLICAAAFFLPSASATADPLFTDVSTSAGVHELQWDAVFPSSVTFSVELLYMSAGVAAGDFDNDGWVDLYVTRVNVPNLLFKNNGAGGFIEIGASAGVSLSQYSSGCGWADVNNDGHLDLYVNSISQVERNHLFINNGNSTFTEDAIARGVDMPQVGPNGSRSYTSVAFGDYDLDGDLDMYVTEWRLSSGQNTLFQNDGTGHFTNVTSIAGLSVTNMAGFAPRFTDIDNDGWPDLLVAADFLTSKMFHNNQDGTFTDITNSANVGTDENGMGATTGDIDHDGDIDWFVTSIFDPDETCSENPCIWGNTGNRFYSNLGSLAFADTTDTWGVRNGYWGWGTSFLDYDNDGDLDLGMTNGLDVPFSAFEDPFNFDPVRLWRNDGAGTMTEVAAAANIADTRSGKGFAVFDYDRDGDLDIYVANNGDYPVVGRNDGGNDNDWLQVRLTGIQTNSFGVGARIYVQTENGGTEQMHEMSASSNYMSHNPLVAHFGLGNDAPSIHQVRVVWPISGFETILSDVAPNQFLTIVEPQVGDCNFSNATDTDDVACFAACLDGPSATFGLGCNLVDFDNDQDVDLFDYQAFCSALNP